MTLEHIRTTTHSIQFRGRELLKSTQDFFRISERLCRSENFSDMLSLLRISTAGRQMHGNADNSLPYPSPSAVRRQIDLHQYRRPIEDENFHHRGGRLSDGRILSSNNCVERTLHPRHGCCVRTPRAAGSRPLTHDVRSYYSEALPREDGPI